MRASAELVQVLAQHRHQLGMDGHAAGVTVCPVFERAGFTGLAAVGPV